MCGYVGTYHACDYVINGTITICPCPDNCKVCQEEVINREYYDCRWQKNEDGYTVCGMCMEKSGCRAICEACFYTRCEKEKKNIQVGIAKDVMTKKGSFSELFVSGDRIQNFLTQKELQTNMSSDMPFTFNAVELYVVTINERPWTRAREVCKALEHNKKTADLIKAFCSRESYA